MIVRIMGAAVLLANSLPPCLYAQDTARVQKLPEVVVSAERSQIPIAQSTAAVTVLGREQLQALPVRTVAEALRQVPGLAFVDFGGLDSDPQPIARGFYGGGEAEYVLVLLDGEPVNAVGSGRVNWDLIPLSAVESIEVIRGPASPLYGDAAIGAVVRVRTIGERLPRQWSASGGQHGLARLSWSMSDRRVTRGLAVFADASRQDGYRSHSGRSAYAAGATLPFANSSRGAVELSVFHHRRSFAEPGPLADTALSVPERSSVFFKFDETDERFWRVAARGTRAIGGSGLFTAHATVDGSRTDGIRTIPLAVDFADTKRRDLRTARLAAATQVQMRHQAFGRSARVVAGTDLSHGRTVSAYFSHTSGDASAYSLASGNATELDTETDARRITAAGFLQYELDASSAVRLVLGVRADRLLDRGDPASVDSAGPRARHTALSPRVGANVAYARSARHRGHFYLSAGRSFKAPTLDQLYDRRTVPIPFPPFTAAFSNSQLRPQRAKSAEAGVRHWIGVDTRRTTEFSLSGYAIEMRDELDFDLQQLRFVNIGRSIHRGLEASLSLPLTAVASTFAMYSLQHAVSRSGANFDNQLKAIPRRAARIGAAVSPGPVSATVVGTMQGGTFLDDANTVRLPGYTRLDARLGYRIRGFRVWADVFNVFNRVYSTTGFPDPSGSGLTFSYPAAKRVVQIGVANDR